MPQRAVNLNSRVVSRVSLHSAMARNVFQVIERGQRKYWQVVSPWYPEEEEFRVVNRYPRMEAVCRHCDMHVPVGLNSTKTWQWMLAHLYGYDEDDQCVPSACMISQQGRAKWQARHVAAQKMLKHILHGKGWSAPTPAPPPPLVLHRPSWANWLSYEIIYNVTPEDFRVHHEHLLRRFIRHEICQDNAPLVGFAFICPALNSPNLSAQHAVVQERPPMLIATYGVKAVLDQANAANNSRACTPGELERWYINESELVRFLQEGSLHPQDFHFTDRFACKLGPLYTRLHMLATWCSYDGDAGQLSELSHPVGESPAVSSEDESLMSERELQSTDESRASTEQDDTTLGNVFA
jgi:hypothetical protein